MSIKTRYRITAAVLALSMLGNNLAVYADRGEVSGNAVTGSTQSRVSETEGYAEEQAEKAAGSLSGNDVSANSDSVFELTVAEDSVYYTHATVHVRWVDTDAIGQDEIVLNLFDSSTGAAAVVTLTKGSREEADVEIMGLLPGTTYNLMAEIYQNEEFIPYGSVSFTTKEAVYEAFTEALKPSKEDIARKYREVYFDYNLTESYEREVNHRDGGLLSAETLQNAVNYINMIRYTAGIPADVIYDEEYSSLCNALAELNRLNGGVSYAKPEGITDEFYERACEIKNAGATNMSGFGAFVPLMFALPTWMVADTGSGHRQRFLSPETYIFGLGRSGIYVSMYAENLFAAERAFDKGYVHWPAANMPVELSIGAALFGGATDYEPKYSDTWSLYLSSEYDAITSDTDIGVQVTNQKTGETWDLTRVDDIYGQKNYIYLVGSRAIQFGMNEIQSELGVSFHKGDEVLVSVKGTTIGGVDAPITYTVSFFSLKDIDVPAIPAESISILSEAAEVMETESLQMEAQILPKNATNQNVLWSVESVDGKGQAEITKEGVLTGTGAGVVRVTAACESDPSIAASVQIRVTEWKIPVESIALSKTSLRLEKGDTGYISVSLEPRDTTENEVIYASAAPEKVSVENGYVHALDVTQEPVALTVSAGSIGAVCMVEVYEPAEEKMDKNYDTRITNIVMSGESDIYIGESGIIKLYPVTNGQYLEASEYEIAIACSEKYLSVEPVASEDYGCWYRLTGTGKGKQKLTVKMTSRVEGNDNPETVTRNFTFTVKEKTEEAATEISTIPALVKNKITINQNTQLGTALDIRLMEGNTAGVNVYLTSKANDGTEDLFSITSDGGSFYIQTKEIGANKKYSLILHIATEQGNWEYPVTVITKKSFPSVSVKQTVKPNIQVLNEDAVLKITGKEQIKQVAFQTESADFYQKSADGEGTQYSLTIGQSEHGKKLNKKGIVEIAFEGYRAVYSKKVTLGTVSKKIKSHTLASNAAKVTLNSTACAEVPAAVKMSLKNSAEPYPVKIFTSGTNNKAKQMLSSGNLYFTYNKNTGALYVFAKASAPKGTYKYKLTGSVLENGSTIDASGSVTLTVVVATAIPVLKLKASGSIDLIARETSCVTYTPTVKNYAGHVAAVELEGDAASNFYARVDENGKIKVYAREKAMVYPKTTYKLDINVTLTNGYVFKVKDVKIKPKQSLFKAVAEQKTITLYRNEINGQPVLIKVKKPVSSQVAYIRPVSVPEGISYNSEDNTIKITERNIVKTGKYKITFEVTPKGAYRSIRPSKVTLSLIVR